MLKDYGMCKSTKVSNFTRSSGINKCDASFYLFLLVLILDIISLILTKFPYSLIITVLFILFGYYFPFTGY
jgi:hypothetical protein